MLRGRLETPALPPSHHKTPAPRPPLARRPEASLDYPCVGCVGGTLPDDPPALVLGSCSLSCDRWSEGESVRKVFTAPYVSSFQFVPLSIYLYRSESIHLSIYSCLYFFASGRENARENKCCTTAKRTKGQKIRKNESSVEKLSRSAPKRM